MKDLSAGNKANSYRERCQKVGSRGPYRVAESVSSGLIVWTMAIVALLTLTACRHEPEQTSFRPFTFVQMGDPQIGFSDYSADLDRFERAVEQINELGPDLVVICGDLVHNANEESFADFNAAKARLKPPVYAVPGNHDVGNEPTPKTLERYRRLVGRDYYSEVHKGCLFVMLNSQLWKSPVPGETERQEAWLKRALRSAAGQGQPVIIVMHHPLFVVTPEEADEYFNLQLAKRTELLDLFERSGVVAVLSGHTHTAAALEHKGMRMVRSENTSRNFDKRPFGFTLWHASAPAEYRHEFVPLASRPQTQTFK